VPTATADPARSRDHDLTRLRDHDLTRLRDHDLTRLRDHVLTRLRDEPGQATALAQVLLDLVLATPVREFIDPTRIVPAFVAGLRASVLAPAPDRLAAAIARHQRQATARPGPLAERIPPELQRVLQTALRRPFTPGRELVRAAVDHAGMRTLVRTILHTTLLDFATRLRSAMPDTAWIPGAGIRSKLMGVAKGVASAVGAEVERQLEDRVRSFVDGALGRAIDMIVERASDPRFAGDMASWRGDAVRSILDLPESVFLAERRKLDPQQLVADLHAAATAVARWDRLPVEATALLQGLVDELQQTTIGELLADTGFVEAWRGPLATEVEHHLRRLFVDPGFTDWLSRLLEAPGTPGHVPPDMPR